MKKLLFVLLSIFIFSATASAAPIGTVIGEAQNTDIVAYINHYAVPSYAVNGTSVIVAEDLRNFGFDVIWDNASRTLTIARNAVTTANELSFSKNGATGSKFADLLSTDIAVYANGQRLSSYAINGYTMIPIEELTMFGSVNWVQEERAIKLWIDGFDTRSEKQAIGVTTKEVYVDMAFNDLANFLKTRGTYQSGSYTLSSYDTQLISSISYTPSMGVITMASELSDYQSKTLCYISISPGKSAFSYYITFLTSSGYAFNGSGEMNKAYLNQNMENITFSSTYFASGDDSSLTAFSQLGANMLILTTATADKLLYTYNSPVNIMDLGFINMSNQNGFIV